MQEIANSDPVVRAGAVVALRLFDIAYSIDLAAVEESWARHRGESPRRARFSTTPEKAVSFGVPPVLLSLDPVDVDIEGTRVSVAVSARCYDFGVVVLALRMPIADRRWVDYVADVLAVDRAVGLAANNAVWPTLLQRLQSVIAPALLRPSPAVLAEDYLIAIVNALDRPLGAAQLQQQAGLIPLLSGERRKLSEAEQRELLRQSFSYYEDDLVVLAWDRAFIYEPRGDSDVADVLEVANAQLLELRYYDDLLDAELPQMYDRVEQARRTYSLLSARRFADLARGLYKLVAEVTELTEKVDNALKVTEDVYLARIYAAALNLFRVPKLSAAVDRKLAIIRDTYAALYDEASDRRSELLELAIVFLILVELILALLRL